MWFILIFTSFYLHEESKDIRFNHLSVKNGLSQSTVNTIIQDKFGFIWIGTQDKLNRFDGYQFEKFSTNPFDSTTISSNVVTDLHEDRFGELWVGTDNGLNLYDRKNKQFIRIRLPDNSRQAITKVTSVEKRIFFSTQDSGTYEIDRETLNASRIKGMTEAKRSYLIFSDEETLWFNSRGGILIFNSKTSESHLTLENHYAFCMLKGDNNSIWIGGTKGRFYRYDKDLNVFQNYKIPQFTRDNVEILSIVDKGSELWLFTYRHSLFVFDKKTEKIVQKNILDAGDKINESFYTAFKDDTGVIWTGTHASGVLYYNPYNIVFEHIGTSKQVHTGSEQSIVWFITSYNPQHILFSTADRNYLYTKYKKSIQTIPHIPNYGRGTLGYYVLYRGSSGNIYSSIFGKGLAKYNIVENTFTPLSKEMDRVKYIRGLTEDDSGNLYAYSENSSTIYYFNFSENKTHSFKIKGIKFRTIYDLFYDTSDVQEPLLWISTGSKGAIRYSINDSSFVNYQHDSFNPRSLSSNFVSLIRRDSRGLYWVATSAGLNILNSKNEAIYHFSERNGLPNNTINGILEDNYSNMWLSTNMGIAKVNVLEHKKNVKLRFTGFTYKDGLKNIEYANPSFYKDDAGILYFGGANGIDVIDPSKVKTSPYNPKTLITGVLTDKKKYRLPDCTEAIQLNPSTEVIEFEYVSLNYTALKSPRYAYRLVGFDKDWVYAGKKRSVRYTNLSPGNYTFEVKSLNSNGIWNKSVAQITLQIIPPFWKTLPFFVLVSGLLFSAIVIAIRRQKANRKYLEYKIDERTHELKIKNKQLHVANEEIKRQSHRIQAINDYLENTLEKLNDTTKFKDSMVEMIAHDIKNPLNTILTLSEEPISKEATRTVYYSANQILNLVLNLLETHKYNNGQFSIERKVVSLRQIIDSSIKQVSLLVEQKCIRISCDVDEQLSTFCDSEIITRVIVNLLTNAIKYSEYGGEIDISCKIVREGYLEVSVKDYGLGIPEDKLKDIFSKYTQINKRSIGSIRSTGIGLTFCHIALEAHNHSIWVQSKENDGTCFTFGLDLSEEESSYKSPQKMDLSSKNPIHLLDNQEFESYLTTLKKLDVYDSSDIIHILTKLKELDDSGLDEWCKNIESAVYNSDQDTYKKLLNLISEMNV